MFGSHQTGPPYRLASTLYLVWQATTVCTGRMEDVPAVFGPLRAGGPWMPFTVGLRDAFMACYPDADECRCGVCSPGSPAVTGISGR